MATPEQKRKKRARKKAFFVFLYSLFAKLNFADELKFMNHGYAPLKGDPDFLQLEGGEEKYRYALQLYHFLADLAKWKGLKGVEVSSGNGGGCDYIYKTFEPETLIGIDLAPSCIKYSEKYYARQGLSFQVGDAQNLPVESHSVDIVINVESSLNYPKPERFIEEVNRILKPGGHFIYADYFRPARLGRVEKAIVSCGFKERKKLDISKNILRSMELGEPGKQALLKKRIPFFFRDLFSRFIFAGQYYEEERQRFISGDKTYITFLLQKPKS